MTNQEATNELNGKESSHKDFDNDQSQSRSKGPRGPSPNGVELVPPDGGWGWMVLIGSFTSLVLCTFPLFGFGILYSPIFTSFNTSSTKIAWIFNVHRLMWNSFALFLGPLTDEFTWRKVAIFGGILSALSLILSGFVPAPEYLFFTYSVLGGLGGNASHIASLIAVSKYFIKHRGLAIGFMSMGTTVSTFLSPLVANYLLEIYGYVGASLLYGGIALNQCVGGALLQPLKWHMKPAQLKQETELEMKKIHVEQVDDLKDKEQADPMLQQEQKFAFSRKSSHRLSTYSIYSNEFLEHSIKEDSFHQVQHLVETEEIETSTVNQNSFNRIFKHVINSTYDNLKALKYKRVVILSLGAGFLVLGHINFQLWIPFVVTNAGYSLEAAAWCVSVASIANIFGRVLVSVLSDRKFFNVTFGHMFGMLCMGISIIAFSLSQYLKLFLIFVCCWGFGCGITESSYANNMINIMGVELFPAVIGIASLCKGIFSVIFGPLAGVIRDATSSYTYALSLLGASELLGFILYLFFPLAERYDKILIKKEALNAYK